MARTPPVEHRTIYPVVEGPEGDFTISFKEGQENLDQGGFASIHIGYDESGRKLALKWPRPNWALGGRDDQERVRFDSSIEKESLIAGISFVAHAQGEPALARAQARVHTAIPRYLPDYHPLAPGIPFHGQRNVTQVYGQTP